MDVHEHGKTICRKGEPGLKPGFIFGKIAHACQKGLDGLLEDHQIRILNKAIRNREICRML